MATSKNINKNYRPEITTQAPMANLPVADRVNGKNKGTTSPWYKTPVQIKATGHAKRK